MRHWIRRFASDDQAATSVEYAVMLALILMVIFASIALLGTNTKGSLQNTNTQLNSYGFGGGGS